MEAFKGFNSDWTCRGFQYEIGKTYTHDGEISLCNSGFHACEQPFDVLSYYPPTGQFAVVELDGVAEKKDGDSKRVAKSITIKAVLNIAGLIHAQVEWISKQADAEIASGDFSKAASSGNSSTAASSGNYSTAASSGKLQHGRLIGELQHGRSSRQPYRCDGRRNRRQSKGWRAWGIRPRMEGRRANAHCSWHSWRGRHQAGHLV